MLISVGDFRRRVATDINGVVADLQQATLRSGSDEEHAWRQSLPKLSEFLASPSLQPLHLYFEDRGNLALEYQLPASGSFADVVLLGKNRGQRAGVVIELKDWTTRADKAGKAEGLIERRGAQELHPSDQVRGYAEYCRHFHSAVEDHDATVHGCVLFTRDFITKPYSDPPNEELVRNYPIFTMADEDLRRRVPAYFKERISEADPEWASSFTSGHYRQKRGFIQQIAKQILSAKSRPFELLDNQRRAFALCKAIAAEALKEWKEGSARRKVVLVIGPPGSGKSAVAARLWADLSLAPDLPQGDLMFVTTSLSQNTNWTDIFGNVGAEGAQGVVRKASTYYPIHTGRVGYLRRTHGAEFMAEVSEWRQNLAQLTNMGEQPRDGAGDMANLVSIVDEAHSLINPGRDGGIGQFGFAPTLGPQAYHVMRASLLTFLFLDPEQGFRQRENTTIDDLQEWARDLDAGDPITVSLEGVQFRCAGSTEFVSWVESLLSNAPAARNEVLASAWYVSDRFEQSVAHTQATGLRAVAEPRATYGESGNVVALKNKRVRVPFDFRIFANPTDLEDALRSTASLGESMRLVSSYARDWKTQGSTNPHLLPPSQQDFHFSDAGGWSRVWNVVHGQDDYSFFVQGKTGSQIANDPLAEVGCPYAVRGFDYDYIGLLWLEDLVWRSGRWVLNLDFVFESGLKALARRARADSGDPASETLLTKVKQAYRILLTRGLKGQFIWIADPETREHVAKSLSDRGVF